jgi:hypothetical protein
MDLPEIDFQALAAVYFAPRVELWNSVAKQLDKARVRAAFESSGTAPKHYLKAEWKGQLEDIRGSFRGTPRS